MKTIDYYNNFADAFAEATLHVDMASLYQPFLTELPQTARILDVGCGAGRDTLAFKNKGYKVEAIDYSEELSVLGFLTDKERSHKVAEWADAQGKENNYLVWMG
jgi:ubiquinone/menaquinone biosynthesis C-methylase UbiE